MSSLSRALISSVGAMLAHVGFAAPEVLIVQRLFPREGEVDRNVGVAPFLADAILKQGKVVPIQWSLADPVFTSWLEARHMEVNVDAPTLEKARAVAKSMKVAYLLWIQARKSDGKVEAQAELFKGDGGKAIWMDAQTFSVQIDGRADWLSGAMTAAETWTTKLGADPWKPIRGSANIPVTTPPPDPGKESTEPTPAPAATPPEYDEQTLQRAIQFLAKGQSAEAVVLLRQCVDAAPMDGKARSALIRALLSTGMAREAAEEARRAVRLNPQNTELHLLAARAWLSLGNVDEAQTDLNEALAREPNRAETQVLRGEMFLAKGKPEAAAEAYTAALDVADSFDVRIGRALAYALSGRTQECVADLQKLPKPLEGELYEAYPRIVRSVSSYTSRLIAEGQSLIEAASRSPKSADVILKAGSWEAVCSTLSTFVSGLSAPVQNLTSHQQRDLAQKLLAQAAGEILEFARTGIQDSADEAGISLMEARKRQQEVESLYASERARK